MRDEVAKLRGAPPDTADADTAKFLDYSAELRTELGDIDGSIADLERKKAINQRLPKGKAMAAPASFSADARTVFELHAELMAANLRLRQLIRQDPALREAIKKKIGPSESVPQDPTTRAENSIAQMQQDIAIFRSFERIYSFLLRQNPTESDFDHIALVQEGRAMVEETLQDYPTPLGTPAIDNRPDARDAWQAAVDTAKQRIEWARREGEQDAAQGPLLNFGTVTQKSEKQIAVERNAAVALVNAQLRLVHYFQRRSDFAAMAGAANDELKIIVGLSGQSFEQQRFEASTLLATALARQGLKQQAEAALQRAAKDYILEQQNELQWDWIRYRRAYALIATKWSELGEAKRAIEVAQEAVNVLQKAQAASPPGTFDFETLALSYNKLCWLQVLGRKYDDAIVSCDAGLTIVAASDESWKGPFLANKAHAFLLRGDIDAAEALYLEVKDVPTGEQRDGKAEVFAQEILDDFDSFEKMGITSPSFAAIREMMRDAVRVAVSKP